MVVVVEEVVVGRVEAVNPLTMMLVVRVRDICVLYSLLNLSYVIWKLIIIKIIRKVSKTYNTPDGFFF